MMQDDDKQIGRFKVRDLMQEPVLVSKQPGSHACKQATVDRGLHDDSRSVPRYQQLPDASVQLDLSPTDSTLGWRQLKPRKNLSLCPGLVDYYT